MDARIESYLTFAGDHDPGAQGFWDDVVQAGCSIADVVVLRWVADARTMGPLAAVAARDPQIALAYKRRADRLQPLSRAARSKLEEGKPIAYRYRDPASRSIIPPQMIALAEALGIVYGFILPLRRRGVLLGVLVLSRRDRPLDQGEEETVGRLADVLMPAVERRA